MAISCGNIAFVASLESLYPLSANKKACGPKAAGKSLPAINTGRSHDYLTHLPQRRFAPGQVQTLEDRSDKTALRKSKARITAGMTNALGFARLAKVQAGRTPTEPGRLREKAKSSWNTC
jgi:hypothetical protein